MIWNDTLIKEWAMDQYGVKPFNSAMVNPASLDLRLGDTIRAPRWYWKPGIWRLAHRLNLPKWSEPRQFSTYLLKPGEFVLCSSLEMTRIPDDMVAQLLLKSSTGRRGVQAMYAGFGDPGFGDNEIGGATWTWELVNSSPWPAVLEAGKPLMQLVLSQLVDVPEKLYKETGRYNDQLGPTPAR